MAADGITLGPKASHARQGTITTSDGNLSIVTCKPGVRKVTLQIRTADALLQVKGAVQNASPGTTTPMLAGSAWDVTAEMCGANSTVAWSFGVARSASGAVIDGIADLA